jgi:hypothetical protein
MNWKRISNIATLLSLTAVSSFAQVGAGAAGMNSGGHAVASWLYGGGLYFFGVYLMFTALLSIWDHHNLKWLVGGIIAMIIFYGAVPFVQMIQTVIPSGI